MDKVFKIFDIYGSNFNLRINNQSKFKSVTGGILSLLTMGVFLFCCYFFGRDFYLGLNPSVRLEEGIHKTSDISYLSVNNYEEKMIVFYVQKKFSLQAQPFFLKKHGDSIKKEYVKICDNSYLIQNRIISNLDDRSLLNYSYYCFLTNKLNLTTSSYDDAKPPITLHFQNCKLMSEEDLVKTNTTCDLNSTQIVENTFLSFYVEKVGFSPQTKDAFVKKFSVESNNFSNKQITTVDLILMEYNLQDDRGWILSTLESKTLLNVYEYKYNKIDLPFEQQIPMFQVRLFLTDEYRVYYRTYSKLQNVLATIGGFMKLIFTVLNMMNFLIRSYLIDIYMIKSQFSEEDESETPDNSRGNILVENSDALTKSTF